MRVFFTLCFMLCTIAVAAPMAGESEVTELRQVSGMLLASAGATAVPTEVIVELTPRPTPEPTSTPHPPSHPPNPVLAPKRPVAKVPVATPAATPEPTPVPKPKATAAPKTAAPKPTASPRPKPTPSGTTYTRDQVIAGIRAGWGGNDEKAIRVADCESALNPRASSPSGIYLGLWQFHKDTWRLYGGTGDPRDHSPQVQTQVAWNVFQDHGWDAWPGCA